MLCWEKWNCFLNNQIIFGLQSAGAQLIKLKLVSKSTHTEVLEIIRKRQTPQSAVDELNTVSATSHWIGIAGWAKYATSVARTQALAANASGRRCLVRVFRGQTQLQWSGNSSRVGQPDPTRGVRIQCMSQLQVLGDHRECAARKH